MGDKYTPKEALQGCVLWIVILVVLLLAGIGFLGMFKAISDLLGLPI